VHENESIYIPMGAVHRLESPGKILLREARAADWIMVLEATTLVFDLVALSAYVLPSSHTNVLKRCCP
jgi:hypothetical protein